MNIVEMDLTNAHILRTRAEELLEEKQINTGLTESETDVKKLLHELQVHQIELELQNEELRQAFALSEKTLRKLTMLFDLSMMGYFTIDSDGTICDLNFAGADILGKRRFSLINSNFKLFISEESISVFNDFFKKIYTDNTKEWCKVMLSYDKTPLCHVYMEGVVTEDEQKCLLTVVDFSKFKNSINN